MKTPALTKLAVAALEDLKAQDIQVIDVKALTPMTDVMVICSGTSSRHVKALAQNVMDEAREQGNRPLGVEGLDQGEWALVDLNGVLVHVMQTQTRAFYQLEKLWAVTPPPPATPETPKTKTKAVAKTASKAQPRATVARTPARPTPGAKVWGAAAKPTRAKAATSTKPAGKSATAAKPKATKTAAKPKVAKAAAKPTTAAASTRAKKASPAKKPRTPR